MRVFPWLCGATCAVLLGTGAASACESFSKLDAATARKMMGVIRQANGDVLDQMEAFRILSCSDEPALRNFAIAEGVRAQGPMVRSMALAEQLFQRDQIRVDLLPDAATGDPVKRWAAERGGALTYKVESVDRSYNCMSFTTSYKCSQPSNNQRLTIDRDGVRLLDRNASGSFSLQADGSLRGVVKPGPTLPDVSARILLQ